MGGNKCTNTLPLSVKAETDLTIFFKGQLGNILQKENLHIHLLI